jgi:hypothetical protein
MSTFKQWSSLQKSVGKFLAKKFYEIGPSGDHLIELFDLNLSTLFCMIDLFMAKQQISCMLMKTSSFQKSVSEFMPKYFMSLTPGVCTIKLFTTVISCAQL